MAEDFGVEDRGHFYDPVGALRDVVVNHLMQVVSVARWSHDDTVAADVWSNEIVGTGIVERRQGSLQQFGRAAGHGKPNLASMNADVQLGVQSASAAR